MTRPIQGDEQAHGADERRLWRDCVRAAQGELGDGLARALAAGRVDRARYTQWLRAERAIGRDLMQLLQPIQATCARPSPLAQWLDAQAQCLQAAAVALDGDLQALGVEARDDSPALRSACRLWPAGKLADRHAVLGAVALLDAVMDGPAQAAVRAVAELPALAHGGGWLAYRLRQLAAMMPRRRQLLERLPLEAPAWPALVRGAHRAARVQRDLHEGLWSPAARG